jgi:hypothetical protein
MNIVEEFTKVIETLQAAKIEFAVCGGFAMAIHGFTRYTKDIEILILPLDIPDVVAKMKACGFDFDVGIIPFTHNSVYRVTKIDGPDFLMLDLLIVNRSLVGIWSERTMVEWNGKPISTVTALGLARMKRLAGRPQDLVDIQTLGFDPNDPVLREI